MDENKRFSCRNKNVFFGTIDGKLLHYRKTGKVVWKTKVLDTDNCNCLFNSPPVIANDVNIWVLQAENYLLKVEFMD